MGHRHRRGGRREMHLWTQVFRESVTTQILLRRHFAATMHGMHARLACQACCSMSHQFAKYPAEIFRIEASGASVHAARSCLPVAARVGLVSMACSARSAVPRVLPSGSRLPALMLSRAVRSAALVLVPFGALRSPQALVTVPFERTARLDATDGFRASAKSSRRNARHSDSSPGATQSCGHTARTLSAPVPCAHTSDQSASQEIHPSATLAHENCRHDSSVVEAWLARARATSSSRAHNELHILRIMMIEEIPISVAAGFDSLARQDFDKTAACRARFHATSVRLTDYYWLSSKQESSSIPSVNDLQLSPPRPQESDS